MPKDIYADDLTEEFDAIFIPNTNYNFSERLMACRFNNAVECIEKKDCGKCGWNPAVAELRSQDIRRRWGLAKDKD